jgi:hypothetical protein
MTVQTDAAGTSATLTVKPLAANCTAIVVHQPDGSTHRLAPPQGGTIKFAVEPVQVAN